MGRETRDFLAQVDKKAKVLTKLLRANGAGASADEASAIRDSAVNFKGQAAAHVSTTGTSKIVDPKEISKMLSGIAEITSDIARASEACRIQPNFSLWAGLRRRVHL